MVSTGNFPQNDVSTVRYIIILFCLLLKLAKYLSTLYTHYFKVDLKKGEVLFVPKHWWHYVESISDSISVNTWIDLVSIKLCIFIDRGFLFNYRAWYYMWALFLRIFTVGISKSFDACF